MMDPEAKCPECSHILHCWHEGSDAICKCINCGWEVVTSYFPPIERDETIYTVFAFQNLSPSLIQLRTLSLITGKNYVETKKLLGNTEFVLFEGRAPEVLPIIEKLKEGEIKFRISPAFDYE